MGCGGKEKRLPLKRNCVKEENKYREFKDEYNMNFKRYEEERI